MKFHEGYWKEYFLQKPKWQKALPYYHYSSSENRIWVLTVSQGLSQIPVFLHIAARKSVLHPYSTLIY